MKSLAFILLLFIPSVVLAQTPVNPEGYKLFWFAGFIIFCIAVAYLFQYIRKKQGKSFSSNIRFKRKKLQVELTKDRLIRPKILTLTITNIGNRYVDLEAPLLEFRKLWSKRKFKLKRVNNLEVYPLYLEVGKKHVVNIELIHFFEHDRKLKRFYWGRIFLQDVDGKKFKSKHVSLRKSLYT